MLTECQPGTVVKLAVDANAIPAGTYRCVEISDEVLLCAVGNDITFGIARRYWGPFIKPVEEKSPSLTTKRDFIKRYTRLLCHERSLGRPRKLASFTFCFVSPRVQGEMDRYCTLAGW
jgi:hypothetical protein